MIFKEENEVIDFIKKHQSITPWVSQARKDHNTFKALVYGDNFVKELIDKIEKIESGDRAEVRRKYSKDIRDMFARVFELRSNVFSASGSSVHYNIQSEVIKTKVQERLKEFKGNKSLLKYLGEYFFSLLDVDPNGIIFTEYKEDEDIYPTYKSINDIRYYESDGQNLTVLLFEPKQVKGTTVHKWRVVDELNDYCVIQNGVSYTIDPDASFSHPFGEIPAVILSDVQKLGTEIRLSPLTPIIELAKDYARDKSILTLYKFLHGFPIHWRYSQQCRPCTGTGKTGKEGKTCSSCNGRGFMGKNDVSDIIEIAAPKDKEDIKLAPDFTGYATPDLKTWEQYNHDLEIAENRIANTIWGTKDAQKGNNETATGRMIDVQPSVNKLSKFSENVEWVANQLANWVIKWAENNPNTSDSISFIFGRGFIIESPDVLLKRYDESRKNGSNITVLDRQLDEYLTAKYRTNPKQLQIEKKKAALEPYVHLSFKETKDIFGEGKANEKYLFQEFWEVSDTDKDISQLRIDFSAYLSQNMPTINP